MNEWYETIKHLNSKTKVTLCCGICKSTKSINLFSMCYCCKIQRCSTCCITTDNLFPEHELDRKTYCRLCYETYKYIVNIIIKNNSYYLN